MIFFFITFFAVFTAINYYIGLRGWQALEMYPALRPWYLIIFLYLSLSYLASKMLQRFLPDSIYMVLEASGSFWFSMILYFIIGLVIVELSRFAGFKFTDYNQAKLTAFSVVVLTTLIITALGYYNTRNPIIRNLDISIKHSGAVEGTLNAVLISDVHFSTINNDGFARKVVDSIKSLNPDIVFVAGDMVDDKPEYLERYKIGYAFKELKPKYGVYGITGNHEFINGIDSTVSYMNHLGITVIRDSFVVIDNRFILAGREDRVKEQFTRVKRKELGAVLKGSPDLPIILMDHTPFGLDDAINNKVDMQVSGHTHHGQLFPLNFVTSAIYEVSTGYHKRENTQFYVSSGVGTWGPPVRTGSRSEIVNLKIKFTR